MMKKRLMAGLLALTLLLAAGLSGAETVGSGTALTENEDAAPAVLPGYSAETGYTYVSFGRYPQWIDGGDPQKMAWKWSRNKLLDNPPEVEPSPILWRVLASDEEQAFLLSEYVLFAMAMHPSLKEYKQMGGAFPETQLGKYLNLEFLTDAFTAEEQSLIRRNEDGTLITLLTAEEMNNRDFGLGKNKKNTARKAWATEYAIRVTDVFVYRLAVGMHTCYWLKDQAKNQKDHTRCIKQTGDIGHIACITLNEGARPALHLNLRDTRILGGSGTKEDPYLLDTAP